MREHDTTPDAMRRHEGAPDDRSGGALVLRLDVPGWAQTTDLDREEVTHTRTVQIGTDDGTVGTVLLTRCDRLTVNPAAGLLVVERGPVRVHVLDEILDLDAAGDLADALAGLVVLARDVAGRER